METMENKKLDTRGLANDATSIKNKASLFAYRLFAYLFLIILTILCLGTIYILIINSTRSHYEIQKGFSFLPGTSFVKNFKNLINGTNLNGTQGNKLPVFQALGNSLLIAALSAGITCYFSALTAYGIHAYQFKLKKFAFIFILLVMMVPNTIASLGLVRMMNDVGLLGNSNKFLNYIPLVVPSVASPVVFFYMKQYIESILPMEMVEAARVDGSGEIRIFHTMVLPILKPAIAIQFIFAFVSSWNNFFIPSLMISERNNLTLPILIANLKASDPSTFDMGKVYVLMLIAVVPVLIVYVCLSKFIIRGLTAGSVKG